MPLAVIRHSPTREQILRMWQAGTEVRDIALATGVSTQRVYQHLHRLRDLGLIEYPREEVA